ncbi:MAG: hypothetical protein GX448_10080 [Planctomycetes bacterium]|nr:hypothetical protein [Planctomycetota bacterium]
MDGIESIGMPASLPLAQVVERTPYSVSLRSRESRDTLGETRRADLAAASSALNDEKEKKIGKDFESVLLTKLFEQVQSSIEDSGFDEEDSGAQQVRGMFWLYLAQDVADKGGFGLWKDIYQQIRQMQGEADPSRALDEEL